MSDWLIYTLAIVGVLIVNVAVGSLPIYLGLRHSRKERRVRMADAMERWDLVARENAVRDATWRAEAGAEYRAIVARLEAGEETP